MSKRLPTAFETGEPDQPGASSEDDEHRDSSFERPRHGVAAPHFGPNETELSHRCASEREHRGSRSSAHHKM